MSNEWHVKVSLESDGCVEVSVVRSFEGHTQMYTNMSLMRWSPSKVYPPTRLERMFGSTLERKVRNGILRQESIARALNQELKEAENAINALRPLYER